MNIFYLDEDPEVAARYHCDKHVTKMLVEYSQILSTAADMNGFHDPDRMTKPVPGINPKVHNWAAESLENMLYLYKLARALHDEYQHRYAGEHKSYEKVIGKFDITEMPRNNVGFTDPPLCMPDIYKVSDDPVECYRHFYSHGKGWTLSWKNREVPDWYVGESREFADPEEAN